MGKTLELNALKNKQTKIHLEKAKDVIAKQRQTLWAAPEGVELSLMRKEGFGGKIKLNCKDEKLWHILKK